MRFYLFGDLRLEKPEKGTLTLESVLPLHLSVTFCDKCKVISRNERMYFDSGGTVFPPCSTGSGDRTVANFRGKMPTSTETISLRFEDPLFSLVLAQLRCIS